MLHVHRNWVCTSAGVHGSCQSLEGGVVSCLREERPRPITASVFLTRPMADRSLLEKSLGEVRRDQPACRGPHARWPARPLPPHSPTPSTLATRAQPTHGL